MRLGIDLQALQTEGSRHRGIGRYVGALLAALLESHPEHEYVFFGSAHLPAPELTLTGREVRLLPLDLQQPAQAEALYEVAVLVAGLDAFFLPSPIEWEGATLPAFHRLPVPLITISYDLIPLLHGEKHFEPGSPTEQRYRRMLENIAHADRVLAISEATRQDTIRLLKVPEHKTHTIYAGVAPFFCPLEGTERTKWSAALTARWGLGESFLLYTGGDTWRKNMEGLIRAYARLSPELQRDCPLVLACKLSEPTRKELEALAAECGVGTRVILTGFVTDDELRALYGLCRLFVFPSLYEGFGLPLAEALACGAPCIAADNSSLPEVLPLPEALFEGTDLDALAMLITHGLTDTAWRTELAAQSLPLAGRFTWALCAERTAAVLALALPTLGANPALRRLAPAPKLRVGTLSPLPPRESGVADYTAEILPYLEAHWSQTLLVSNDAPKPTAPLPLQRLSGLERRLESGEPLDLLLYHIGNSPHHAAEYGLMRRWPGITVLHDYNLNGLLAYLEHNPVRGVDVAEELRHHYGPQEALRVAALRASDLGSLPAKERFSNRRIFTRSLGVILHSKWAATRAQQEFGSDNPFITYIPMLVDLSTQAPLPTEAERRALRQRLGLPEDAKILLTGGIIHATKRSVPLLDTFARLQPERGKLHLVFLGPDSAFVGDFASEIKKRGLGECVTVTGYVPVPAFYDWIDAADICLCLRWPFGGETSGALVRTLSRGRACITTDIGSFGELPETAVHKLPIPTDPKTEVEQIEAALRLLLTDTAYRERLAAGAYQVIATEHDPAQCAARYVAFVEQVLSAPETRRRLLADRVGRQASQWQSALPLETLLEPFVDLLR
ncbi:glycosyltransferase [Armatimonas rosea]|uniref:Glycosyltransferase involved in cell wall biosynthesis n=1 Tax=Armatimonas rosea TaxID=685828 RepID=A0A7W9SQD1_ARMRO|nr:glycosyltransferase [Armatimonas rosea]MBB6050083.1 glycosyltransferase involved in cell wall biosynthesis [Armatimonas rosea]